MTTIPGATEVEQDLFRGPKIASPAHLAWLKRHCGVRAVLDLEIGVREILSGRQNDVMRWCRELGIQLFDMGLNGLLAPDPRDMDVAQNVIADRALRPLYVCCRRGRERTGVTIAVRREITGWSFERAYEEMVLMGCRWPNRWLYRPMLERYARNNFGGDNGKGEN